MVKIEKKDYFNSSIPKKADWFRNNFFCGSKKFIKFKPEVDITKSGCFISKDIKIFKKEHWSKTALRILGFCSIITPIIGVILIKIDEHNWNQYKKTDSYKGKVRKWEEVFAKVEGNAHIYGSELIQSLVRSGKKVEDLRFTHILAKRLMQNANQMFGGEGEFPDSEKPEHFKRHLTLIGSNRSLDSSDYEKIMNNNRCIEGKTSIHNFRYDELFTPRRLVMTPHLSQSLENILFKK